MTWLPLGTYARRGNHSVRPHDAATARSVRTTVRPPRPYGAVTTQSVLPTRGPRGPYARHGDHAVCTNDTAATRFVLTTLQPLCTHDRETTRSVSTTWQPLSSYT